MVLAGTSTFVLPLSLEYKYLLTYPPKCARNLASTFVPPPGEIAGTSTFVLMSCDRVHLLGLYNIWVDLFVEYVTLGYIKLLISFAYDLTFFKIYA